MTPGGTVQFTHALDDGRVLIVEASITDYFEGVVYGHNGEPGWPPEGGEIRDMAATLNGRPFDIPDGLYRDLCIKAGEEHDGV